MDIFGEIALDCSPGITTESKSVLILKDNCTWRMFWIKRNIWFYIASEEKSLSGQLLKNI